MKQVILFFSLFMLIGYLLFTLSSCSDKTPAYQTKKSQSNDSAAIPPQTLSKLDLLPSLPAVVTHDTNLDSKKKSYTDTFERLSLDEAQKTLLPKQSVSPLNAFIYQKNTIKSLTVGDTILLPEINGFEYTLKIKKTTHNHNLSLTHTASIEGEEGNYYAILTEGQKSAFITLYSSNGVYEMEIFGAQGYTYASKDIQNAMIDYSKTDVKIPSR